MINSLSQFFTKLCQKYLPDAYIFSLILTLIVFVLGMGIQGKSAIQMIEFWGDGFWNLMTFTMQMAMILITGFTLAKTPIINKILVFITQFASGPISAVVLAAIVSSIACYINWGFGLIVSGLFAIELAKKIHNVNFPLLVAISYGGFLVWHGGLSGSIPLKLTDPSQNIQNILGANQIALSSTLYSPLNMIMVFATILVLVIIGYLLAKNVKGDFNFDLHPHTPKFELEESDSFASKLENSFTLNLIIAGMGMSYIGFELISGKGLGLNLMIFLFLMLAILFNYTPARFLFSFNNSVRDSSGILLQFPFYAGIMGMMASSGLASSLSQFFVSISDKNTFLLFTYWSAGIVNFFVPSGGGQWAIQGPIILPAAKELGVDFSKAAMAIAWGDAWTNMVQPFWALPLLSIAKLSLKDMMGYSVMIFIISGVLSSLVFLAMS